ncbi:MAG: hypothetical protein ACTSRA_14035, partial [Promethearchaeota archaeon]
LEFSDGKIMLTDFAPINSVTWDLIEEKLGKQNFSNLVEAADGVGQGHWALVPHMNELWMAWLDEIFPTLKRKRRVFFVDPADMSKRTSDHIKKMFEILERINGIHGFEVVISFNDKEISQACQSLGLSRDYRTYNDFLIAGEDLMKKFALNSVVIHSPHFALIITEKDSYFVKEGYTSAPRFTTAAGDHFNGAVFSMLVTGIFNPEEAILFGNSSTAFFVRTGESPDLGKILHFLKNYNRYLQSDIDHVI